MLRATVREASSEATRIMQEVKAALLAQAIEKKDIQTRHFRIYAERYGPEGLLQEDQVQYHVSNAVYVTIRDLDNIGGVSRCCHWGRSQRRRQRQIQPGKSGCS